MRRRRFSKAVWISVSFILSFGVGIVNADDYPSKPIQIVCPWAAGGNGDSISRLVASTLHEFIGQPVVVINKVGGGGVVAASWFQNQKADGYTLFLNCRGPLVTAPLINKAPYTVQDFTTLASLVYTPAVIGVKADSALKSWNDIEEFAKKNPNKLTYAATGPVTSETLCMEWIKKNRNIQIKQIPVEGGGADAARAVLGGHRDLYVSDGYFEGLRYLVSFAPERTKKIFSDVPILKEIGIDYSMIIWYGIGVKSGTPAHIVDKLKKALRAMYESKQYQGLITRMPVEPHFIPGEEIDKMNLQEVTDFKQLFDEIGIKRVQ